MAEVITKTGEVSDPTEDDDITRNYGIGSEWTNVLTGEKWILVNNDAGAAIWSGLSTSVKTMSDTPPTNPDNGQEWQDTTTGLDYTWFEDVDSGQWVLQQIGGGIPAPSKIVSDTAPPSPVQGQEWYDSSTGFDYTFIDDGTSQQWVAITSQNDGGVSDAPNDGAQYIRQNELWVTSPIPAGGTTGQALKKVNATDYNVSWQADPTYTAGTGLSLISNEFANTAPNIVQTTVTGNAGSATILQTARTINGVSFNGSANISITAAPTSSSVGQTELQTGSATITVTLSSGNATTYTLTGGQYCFWPTVHCTGGDSTRDPLLQLDPYSVTTATLPYISIDNEVTGGAQTHVQTRYVQSSPPYDLGNGECGLFVFALVNNTTGNVDAIVEAEDPPWALNGPTNIAGFAPLDKNADMALIPHPFMSATPAQTIVMLDPVGNESFDFITRKAAGDAITEMLAAGNIRIDNVARTDRFSPPGVLSYNMRLL